MSWSSLRRGSTAAAETAQPTPAVATEEGAVTAAARSRVRRRRTLVWAARAATLVVIIGGWQLLTTWKVIDPFFYGKPSGIAR